MCVFGVSSSIIIIEPNSREKYWRKGDRDKSDEINNKDRKLRFAKEEKRGIGTGEREKDGEREREREREREGREIRIK